MESTALTYVFLGIMYTVLFIVVGTVLVHRKRKGEARDERLKQMAAGVPEDKSREQEVSEGAVRRRRRADSDKDDDDEKKKEPDVEEEKTKKGSKKKAGKKTD